MPKLSVIVITKNEAHNIADCLQSVSWADEIIVLDSGSTDDTVAIAKQYTDLVTITPDWPGDGPQKCRALAKTTNDWVLILDADERITPELKQEIINTLPTTTMHGFMLPYQSYYCGKHIRFGDWYGEKHLRLFNKQHSILEPLIVHFEAKIPRLKTANMKNYVKHYSFITLHDVIDTMNDYSDGSAQIKFADGKTASLFTAISHGIWAFLRGFILKLGFLDGRWGFILAVSNAEGSYYRYLKLLHLRQIS